MVSALCLLALSLSGAALARGSGGGDGDGETSHRGPRFRNGTNPSTQSQCRQLAQLTRLTALASNATALDEKSRGDPTKAAALAAKASAAATGLAALQSNTILVAECQQVLAVQDMKSTCHMLQRLEHLQSLASDPTSLDEKAKGNSTKAERIKAAAAEGAAKLAALQGNQTIVGFCAKQQEKGECGELERLQKVVSLAGNATALGNRFGGDGEKMAKFQERVEEAKAKLEELKGDEELVAACAARGEGCKCFSFPFRVGMVKRSGKGDVC